MIRAEKRQPIRVSLIALILISLVCAAFGAISALFIRNRYIASATIGRLAKYAPESGASEDLDELRQVIAEHEAEIEACVNVSAAAGMYWKVLATRLLDRGLYSQALMALEKAIGYYPADASLQYSVGLAASYIAKGSQDFDLSGANLRRDEYLALAESAHSRAIKLETNYARPLYALGVLYVFEMNRPSEAIPILERYLELRRNDADALFLLAAAHYINGEETEAVALYDAIIETSQDPKRRAEAEANKQAIMEANRE